MNQYTKDFLSQFKVDPETIELLEKGEFEEDFDIATLAQPVIEQQSKFFQNQFSSEEALRPLLDQKIGIYKGSLAQKVNKSFGLELTRKQVEELGPEKVLEMANEKIATEKEKITKGNNEELLKELNEKKEAYMLLHNSVQEKEENFELTVKQIEEKHRKELRQLSYKNVFSEIFAEHECGREKVVGEMFREKAMNLVLSEYEVDENGNVTGKNGTHAELPDKSKIVGHAKDIVAYYFNEWGYAKKAHGKTDDEEDKKPAFGGAGQYNPKTMTAEEQEIYERLKAQGRIK